MAVTSLIERTIFD